MSVQLVEQRRAQLLELVRQRRFASLPDLVKALDEHKLDYRAAKIAEADRLFYVAVTRAEDSLLVSGSQRMTPGRKKPDTPEATSTLMVKARMFSDSAA